MAEAEANGVGGYAAVPARAPSQQLLINANGKRALRRRIVSELRELRGMAAEDGPLVFDFGFTSTTSIQG